MLTCNNFISSLCKVIDLSWHLHQLNSGLIYLMLQYWSVDSFCLIVTWTSSGLCFFPVLSLSANRLNKKFFCIWLKQKVILIGNAQSWFESGESLQESRFDETFLVGVEVLIECKELDSSSRFAKYFLIWLYDVPTWSYDVLEYDEYHLVAETFQIHLYNLSVQKISVQSRLSFLGFTSLLLTFLDIGFSICKHSMNGCFCLILLMKSHLEENGQNTPAPMA